MDAGNDVRQETLRFLIEAVEREPADRQVAIGSQINQQGCFSIARWSHYQNELFFQLVVEILEQALACNDLRPPPRLADLNLADRELLWADHV